MTFTIKNTLSPTKSLLCRAWPGVCLSLGLAFSAFYQTLALDSGPVQLESVPPRMTGSDFGQTMETIMPSLHLDKDPVNGLDTRAEALSQIKTLKHLVLTNNHVGYQTVKRIALLPDLEELSLAHCSEIESDSLPILASMKQLRHLSLAGDNLPNEPLKCHQDQ